MKKQNMLIQKYQYKWVNDFKQIKEILLKALEELNINIEHIGSTSIPNLAAKPIIDIDIIYYSDDDFEKVKLGLESVGYYHNGDQGIFQREAFKRKPNKEKHEILDFIVHHLYVCPSESKELKRHLLFRDYLIKHAVARKEYETIKLQIAREANQDRKRYAAIKEIKAKGFIQSIIAKAQ